MSDIRVFWCEETTRARRYLRIYSSRTCGDGVQSYCDAMATIDEVDRKLVQSKYDPKDMVYEEVGQVSDFEGDTRWPVRCKRCAYVFTPKDQRQVFVRQLFKRSDNKELMTREDLPPGAMWNERWLAERGHGEWTGPDGLSVHVKCPDGHVWCVDSRARNCTMPKDKEHKCWVRHGDPRTSVLHVDKVGKTCEAGAGSIDTGKWHGFLHNSILA